MMLKHLERGKLGFPYRLVCIVSGKLHDAAVKKYDDIYWMTAEDTLMERKSVFQLRCQTKIWLEEQPISVLMTAAKFSVQLIV
jgi:hypothetical protein